MAPTSRSMSLQTPTRAAPLWRGDSLGRDFLLPAGGKLDNSTFVADVNGVIFIPAGTVVGRTEADNEAAPDFAHRWHKATTGDEVVTFVAEDVVDAAKNDDVELVRPKCSLVIHLNYLPELIGTLDAGVQALLRANFNLQYAVD